MINVTTYQNQSPDFFRKLSQDHEETLVCLNSGSSFRQKIHPGYLPNPEALPDFKRFSNLRFQLWPETEAEDLKFLWTVKYLGRPELSIKAVCKKVLEGKQSKGISSLLQPFHVPGIALAKIDIKWSAPKALDFISKELDLRREDVDRNYYMVARTMELYRNHVPDFDKLYKTL